MKEKYIIINYEEYMNDKDILNLLIEKNILEIKSRKNKRTLCISKYNIENIKQNDIITNRL